MFKTFFAALALVVLVGCEATTQKIPDEKEVTVAPPKLKGQVVAIMELCKSLQNQMDIFKAYTENDSMGMQYYYSLIYAGECVTFTRPVLAKKIKLEFEKQVNKTDKIEIWKIALNEDDAEVKFFWIAVRTSIDQPNKTKKNEVAA